MKTGIIVFDDDGDFYCSNDGGQSFCASSSIKDAFLFNDVEHAKDLLNVRNDVLECLRVEVSQKLAINSLTN